MPLSPQQIIAFLKRLNIFRKVSDDQLALAASCFEDRIYPAGAGLFEQNAPADSFYVIFSGRVRLSRYDERQNEDFLIGYLQPQDLFGYEALELGQERLTHAEADTAVTLLCLSGDKMVELAEAVPDVVPRLQMLLDSYRLYLSTPLEWLDPEETVYFMARKHTVFLLAKLAPPLLTAIVALPLLGVWSYTSLAATPLILLGLALLILGVWTALSYVDWSNDYAVLTPRRVVFQERIVLLYDSRQEAPLESIQSITRDTTFFGRYLRYGTVTVRTYTGSIILEDLANPEQVIGILEELQSRIKQQVREAELKAIENRIAGKIGMQAPKPAMPPLKDLPPVVKPSSFQQSLADLLQLRTVSGDGTITYRTHWAILLYKTFIPGLIVIALVTALGLRIAGVFAFLNLLAFIALWFFVTLFVFLWWLYQFIDWRNDVYQISRDQVVDVARKPLGSEQRRAAPLKNILSIEYERMGIIGLFLNFGTVYVRIGEAQFDFNNVFNPSEVQRELFRRLAERNQRDKEQQAEDDRNRLTEWLAAYHRVTHQDED